MLVELDSKLVIEVLARFKSWSDTKSPSLESGCFLFNRSQYRWNIARMLNKDKTLRTIQSFGVNLDG